MLTIIDHRKEANEKLCKAQLKPSPVAFHSNGQKSKAKSPNVFDAHMFPRENISHMVKM